MRSKVNWVKLGYSEWIYCGYQGEVKYKVVESEILVFFDSEIFYIADTRDSCCQITGENLLNFIADKIGCRDFLIWDSDFLKVMEFNKIGVFRKGTIQVDH